MIYSRGASSTDLFVESPRADVTPSTYYQNVYTTTLLDVFTFIDTETAAALYPDHYSLIAVTEKREYGISYGRLLYVADSIEALNTFVFSNGFGDEFLSCVTGNNLL